MKKHPSHHLGPLEKYQAELKHGDFVEDEAQRLALTHLQKLYEDLLANQANKKATLLQSISGFLFKNSQNEQEPEILGLYFWGGVGRGKTFLMDVFFECLPFEEKLRLHFHRFMQRIHQELTELQGQSDPLVSIAENMSRQIKVLCLDEFFVKDITDAMLLAGLLDELFKRGVVLVTTSNIVPEALYQDGLQRQRFLPAIDLIKKYTRVVNVDGGVDHRLRVLQQAELFHYPLDNEASESLQTSFTNLAPQHCLKNQPVEILGREIQSLCLSEDVVWFDFFSLCDGPRSQNDYIELARVYHAVLVSNVPVLGVDNDDLARRFISLVDEFYDRNVKLIISADAPINELYSGGKLSFEFERTQSRLLEMQSHEYLAREHLA